LNISAIIAEYNPLHKGHLYQINQTKDLTQCDGLVCIMSGNFVQRGEPAVIDKWSRAKMALENGVDLVLELPVVYSLSSAEFFAHGAVTILNNLGIVNNICFGSELGNVDILYKLAEILIEEPDKFKHYLKYYLDLGNTFPVSRSKALIQYGMEHDIVTNSETASILNNSNNILGIEYCKSLIKNNSRIIPYTVKREGGAYNSDVLDERFSSATAIRKIMRGCDNINILKPHLPAASYNIIENLHKADYKFTFENSMLPYIKYKCFHGKEALVNIPDVTEGLHNRIHDSVITSDNYGEIMTKIKTKRYTYTRISRILCQLFIGFDSFNTSALRVSRPSYVRVLGFNKIGRDMLKSMRKNEDIEIYTKLPTHTGDMLELDLLSTKMYSLINKSVLHNSDYLMNPIRYD
jgi:predicted nucleotidyltransferase